MYPNQAPPLPVDPQTPHQWAFIHGLPNAVPFVPPINASPQLMPYAQQITGHALKVAQDHAGRNAGRTFYFNMLTVNNYQNQDFFELVQSVAELTEFLMGAKRKGALEAIAEAAVTMNSVQAAMMAEKWPIIKTMCTIEVTQGFSQWLQHFQGMAQEIIRWKQPIQPQMQPNQPYQVRPNGIFGGQQQNPQYAPHTGMDPAINRSGSSFWGSPQGASSVSSSSSSFVGGLTKAANRIPIVEQQIVEVSMLQDQPQPIIRSGQVTSFASIANSPTEPVVDHPPSAVKLDDAPPPVSRAWDDLQTEDGSRIVPESLSVWTVNRTADKPYKLAYNPKTHCLFHAMLPSGVVEEILVPWEVTETMEYLKNEIRSDMKAAQPIDPHAPRIVPNYDMLIHMTPVTETMMGISAAPEPADPENTDVPELTPVVLSEVSFSNSVGDMFQMGTLEKELIVEKLELDPEADLEIVSCTESYTDIVKAVACNESDIAWFMRLTRMETIPEVLQMLEAAHDEVAPEVLKEITTRLTDEINIAVKRNLQGRQWIDSVVTDYGDLVTLLEQAYGKHGLYAWYAHQKDVIARALNVLTGDRLTQYWGMLYKPDKIERVSRKMLVFFDRVAVTYVDWSSQDMDVAFVDSGALSEATMPNLYKAIKAMFARTEVSDVPFDSHLMRLNDGVTLQFHQGWLNKDFFLISRF